MTVKNGGNTIDAVEASALCGSHCISRACVSAGWVQYIRDERTPLFIALGIEAEILLPSAKDCSEKPDPKGKALNISP
ncbi:MAG: hypothetical protein RIR12_1544 [Bacteroidota bacterium]|jgi:hypothetical protein